MIFSTKIRKYTQRHEHQSNANTRKITQQCNKHKKYMCRQLLPICKSVLKISIMLIHCRQLLPVHGAFVSGEDVQVQYGMHCRRGHWQAKKKN